MNSHVYMRQTQALVSTLPGSAKIQFFTMPAICPLIYRPSTKAYHTCVAVEGSQRHFTVRNLRTSTRPPWKMTEDLYQLYIPWLHQPFLPTVDILALCVTIYSLPYFLQIKEGISSGTWKTASPLSETPAECNNKLAQVEVNFGAHRLFEDHLVNNNCIGYFTRALFF